MEFTKQELKVIKYALDWLDNNSDTFNMDYNDFPEEWKKAFGRLKLETVSKVYKDLLVKLDKS